MPHKHEVYLGILKHYFRSLVHAHKAQPLAWNNFRILYKEARQRADQHVLRGAVGAVDARED